MKQFNLSEWLQDKSRKVVTRDGRVVKILDTEFESGNGNKSVLAKCIYNNKAAVYVYTTDGKANNIGETENDLFFADEEDGLTEFEKTMIQFSHERNSLIQFEHTTEEINAHLHRYSEKLLDLARKELETNYYTKVLDDRMVFKSDLHDRDMQCAYEFGKQDALKDLPKLKKATEHKNLEKHVAILEDGKVLLSNYLEEGDYYVDLEDLENLPKEE